jgi:hypothetical protein
MYIYSVYLDYYRVFPASFIKPSKTNEQLLESRIKFHKSFNLMGKHLLEFRQMAVRDTW